MSKNRYIHFVIPDVTAKQYQVSYWIRNQNEFRQRPRKHMWPGTKDLTSH